MTAFWAASRPAFFRERRRTTGKCDNLSVLRVRLSQLTNVLGSACGSATRFGGRRPGHSRDVSLICSSASSGGQTFTAAPLVFALPVNRASHRIDRGRRGVRIVTKGDVTHKIRQKVVETFSIPGDTVKTAGAGRYGSVVMCSGLADDTVWVAFAHWRRSTFMGEERASEIPCPD